MELKPISRTKTYEKDDYQVEMSLDISMELYDLVKDIFKAEKGSDEEKKLSDKENIDTFCRILPIMIVDWNFADRDSKKLAITEDNLKKLPIPLFSWLITVFSEVFTVESN